ncbi:MAG: UDP-3-O-(3-hydroxymyristoyl)glucosamine N-acyltransferase [Gammaproteobacteria bacterium]|nr:UDP-3-O-(3-hydroxymyristoyl)glucosamine N-acyltransferase [Gammaproteobacteria bacterium]
MAHKLGDICLSLGLEFVGDPETIVTGLGEWHAAGPDKIGFLAKADAQLLSKAKVGVLVVPSALVGQTFAAAEIASDKPYLTFAKISQWLYRANLPAPEIAGSAVIDASALIHGEVEIGHFSHIGRAVLGGGCRIGHQVHIGNDVVLGARCVIESGAKLENCTLGDDCWIGPNVVIGAEGFGNIETDRGWQHIYHVGRVQIGDAVHIGANSTIDRGTLGDTVLADGVRIDNLVQIGHNAHIGQHTAIAAGASIAGSARIGKRCKIGGASAIGGHFEIVDDTMIAGGSVVTSAIEQPGVYKSGTPVVPLMQWNRIAVHWRRLINKNK